MDNLLTVAFEAHSGEANHHRRYEVRVGRDLFDDWTVVISYGRVGQGGQQRRYGSPDRDALRAIVRDRLRRRLSAPRRIGCAYRLTTLSQVSGFAAADWLPGDVMQAFFAAA